MIAKRSYLMISFVCSLALGLVGTSLVGGAAYASVAGVKYGTSNSGYAVNSSATPPDNVSAEMKVPSFTCGAATTEIAIGAAAEDSGNGIMSSTLEVGCSGGK